MEELGLGGGLLVGGELLGGGGMLVGKKLLEQLMDSFPMLATTKRISVSRLALFSLLRRVVVFELMFLAPECPCGDVLIVSCWRRIVVDAHLSCLVVCHD